MMIDTATWSLLACDSDQGRHCHQCRQQLWSPEDGGRRRVKSNQRDIETEKKIGATASMAAAISVGKKENRRRHLRVLVVAGGRWWPEMTKCGPVSRFRQLKSSFCSMG
ncbi:hypothetical protein L2E82_22644 [Cichorium intybus]|uniref:Uncharacterized protein n=1 Tax=Cichorium intybus TaxID=13427 RepID=A0ACB9DYR7_CICIN|nr:hypothetical protein L2E82_22644 [Cichorium intybus]